jgi:hypothetical protein
MGGHNHGGTTSSLRKHNDYLEEAEDTMGNDIPKYSAGKTQSNFYHSK